MCWLGAGVFRVEPGVGERVGRCHIGWAPGGCGYGHGLV